MVGVYGAGAEVIRRNVPACAMTPVRVSQYGAAVASPAAALIVVAARSAAVPGLKRATGTVPGSSSGGPGSRAAARAGSGVSTARRRKGSGSATLLRLQQGGTGFSLKSEQR